MATVHASTDETQRLSWPRLMAYSGPAPVMSLAALPMALFVPAFYADDLGVDLASVGAGIAVSRLLDIVTDPVIGALSDRLRLPFGRRKPWMVLGTPVFMLAVWQIFVPGEEASATHLTVWSAILVSARPPRSRPASLPPRLARPGLLFVLGAVIA